MCVVYAHIVQSSSTGDPGMNAIAPSFSHFLDSIKADDSPVALSPQRLAEALGLPQQRLAEMARVHRNTVSMAPNSQKLQDALVDVVRVISAAHELSGDIDRALFWFRNHPIADFGHRTPMQLVEEGKAQTVIDYIESLSAGASG